MKLNKIEELRQAVDSLLTNYFKVQPHNKPFCDERTEITKAVLNRMKRACYGPAWAKELLRLYE